jgi:hypothetical protein
VPRPFGNAAGYGFELTEKQKAEQRAHSHPQLTLESCIRSAREILSSTMSTSQLAPWHTQPQRSRTRCLSARAVLNVNAVTNPAANAAGLVLAAANSTIVPITVLTPGTGNEALPLFTLTPNRSSVIRIKSWGITVVNAPDESLQTGVTGGTVGGPPAPPDPAISSNSVDLHQDATALITENKTLTVTVRNLTAPLPGATPLLILFGICFYEFEVTRYSDDPSKMRLQSGFGPDCGGQ